MNSKAFMIDLVKILRRMLRFKGTRNTVDRIRTVILKSKWNIRYVVCEI